jgi:hypothetical protein
VNGDPRAVDGILGVMEPRARLLGNPSISPGGCVAGASCFRVLPGRH